MNTGKDENNEQRRHYEPLIPERPWPTPTPGIPIPRRREEDRTLRQILEKLVDIEKRLEKIEKLVSGKIV